MYVVANKFNHCRSDIRIAVIMQLVIFSIQAVAFVLHFSYGWCYVDTRVYLVCNLAHTCLAHKHCIGIILVDNDKLHRPASGKVR